MSDPETSVTRTLTKPLKQVFNAGKPDERVEEITTITMRTDVLAEDLMAADAHEGDAAKAIAIIAQLSGLPFATVRKLGRDDFGFFADKLDVV